MGPELKAQGLTEVFYWMMNKTVRIEPLSKAKKESVNSGVMCKSPVELTGILVIIALYNFRF